MATSTLSQLLDQLIVASRRAEWVDADTKLRALRVANQIAEKPDGPPASEMNGAGCQGLYTPPEEPVSVPNFDHRAGPVTAQLSAGRTPKKRNPASKKNPADRKNASWISLNTFHRCSCGAEVKNKNRSKHERKKCPLRRGAGRPTPTAKTGAGSKKRSSRRTSAPTARDGGSGAGRDERRLDATTEYAHVYRDNGRFGSHPSHDDYGEAGRA